MSGGDVRGFVAPDYPGSERDLAAHKKEPKISKAGKQTGISGAFPRRQERCNDAGEDQNSQEPVRHLKPNLGGSDVRQSAGIAPGVDFRDASSRSVGNDGAIGE